MNAEKRIYTPSRLFVRGFSRQVFHPVEAVDFHHRDEAFQNLVAFEAGENHPRGRTEQGAYNSRRKHDEKDENKTDGEES